ncbi:Bax inhibitor-1/YccA family protein [Nocardioides pocheonensis]|uniref:Bax inhibitor-1/YccA family protein n=1 Tax=Nocardioides pocheonensis TaxID=661485 RepID=A0A3N0GL88_9ACTN|nr:Bax inhibitor-1/YccA family protein [Nocardioides pocheonensis]RNM12946.1 Bax inhibitor-1/YccA family protein [Nocardioides pocheonensis]
MQSNNPVFARSEGFNGKGGTAYADFGVGVPATHTGAGTGRMTVDTVVQKTGITLGVLVLAAAVTWIGTGDVVASDGLSIDPGKAQTLYTLSMIGAFGGFILAMVNSFKRATSPALVVAYAALEGVFIGAMSKVFQLSFGPGVVTGAVLGTVAAVAGTLAAYKFFDIQVGAKFRTWVIAAMFGFVAVSLLDMLLGFFGNSFGFNGFGPMGLLSSVLGLGLGVLMLILDFDFVERGVAAGLPERESWRAAFGLTVTIVWIYIELLRILAIFTRR